MMIYNKKESNKMNTANQTLHNFLLLPMKKRSKDKNNSKMMSNDYF